MSKPYAIYMLRAETNISVHVPTGSDVPVHAVYINLEDSEETTIEAVRQLLRQAKEQEALHDVGALPVGEVVGKKEALS
jgi:hypothetical protein